jgi:hypothetical protein
VLSRFPARWNHLAEKESRHFNMLEQILIGEAVQLRRDLLWRYPSPSPAKKSINQWN